MTDYIVLGGGWAGIVLALELKNNFPNIEVMVLEKSGAFGGLLRSNVINDHVFDVGGSHVIFSRDSATLNKMLTLLSENFVKHQRKAYVLLGSAFVPYPIENNLYILPQEERAEAITFFLETLLSRDADWAPSTFKEWIYGFFGKWIAEKYLVPYNLKIWKRPLEEIDVDWVHMPGRLPIPDWRDVVKSAMGMPTVGYVEQSVFYYPKCGGIQTLADSAVKKSRNIGVKFLNKIEVRKISRSNGEWVVNDKFRAKKLVSTIPLNELVKALDAPTDIVKVSEELDYNKVVVVGLALKKTAPRQHWVYMPNSDITFHRYAWISNYSARNAPNGESTLLAEVTIPPHENVDIEKLKARVVAELEKLNVLKRDEVMFTKAWLHNYGYPIHKIGHKEKRETIMTWLNDQDVVSVGRWGSWRYWNMDKTYEQVLRMISERAMKNARSSNRKRLYSKH